MQIHKFGKYITGYSDNGPVGNNLILDPVQCSGKPGIDLVWAHTQYLCPHFVRISIQNMELHISEGLKCFDVLGGPTPRNDPKDGPACTPV